MINSFAYCSSVSLIFSAANIYRHMQPSIRHLISACSLIIPPICFSNCRPDSAFIINTSTMIYIPISALNSYHTQLPANQPTCESTCLPADQFTQVSKIPQKKTKPNVLMFLDAPSSFVCSNLTGRKGVEMRNGRTIWRIVLKRERNWLWDWVSGLNLMRSGRSGTYCIGVCCEKDLRLAMR